MKSIRSSIRDGTEGRSPVELSALVLCGIAGVLSLLMGILSFPVIGHDAYVHLNWLEQFTRLTREGIAYPRWLPLSFGGYGAATFYFYPPLEYFVASLLSILTGLRDASALYNFLQVVLSVLSGFSFFLFARRLGTSSVRIWLGSFLYAFAPYRFGDVYIRSALGEHTAFVFIPILLLGAYMVEHKERFGAIVTSAGFVGLFLSSIPLSLLAAVAWICYIVIQRTGWRKALQHVIGLTVAVLLCGFYLWPAIQLRDWIHVEHLNYPIVSGRAYQDVLGELLHGGWGTLMLINLATLLFGIVTFILLFRNRDRSNIRGWLMTVVAISILVQLPFVSQIIRIVPGINIVQYSWRFNTLIVLAFACYVTIERAAVKLLVIPIAIVSIGVSIFTLRNIHTEPEQVAPFYLDAPEYAARWTPANPDSVILGANERMDYAAIWSNDSGMHVLRTVRKGELREQYQLRVSRTDTVTFHRFYWPLWKISVDGNEAKAFPTAKGLLAASMEPGDHEVKLELGTSKAESAGRTMTIVGGIGLLAFGLKDLLGRRKMEEQSDT